MCNKMISLNSVNSHEQNRYKICAPCGKKINFNIKNQKKFEITPNLCDLIKEHINEKFSLSDERFPLGICGTCKTVLYERVRKIKTKALPTMPNYGDLRLSKNTRSYKQASKVCDCYICVTSRCTSHKKTKKGRGHKKEPIIINSKSGNKIENQTEKDQDKSKIKRANSASTSAIVNMINQLPDKQQEQIVSTVLLKKAATLKPSVSKNKNIELQLSNERGLKTKVVLNAKKIEPISFSENSLDNFMLNAGLSQQKMKNTATFIRSQAGRKAVPKNYESHVSDKLKSLDSLYNSAIYEFETSSSTTKEKRPVIYADATELVDAIVELRNLIGYYKIKVMADGGQGFFKMCLSIIFENYTSVSTSEEDDENYEPMPKKRIYSEKKEPKLTSVKKLIMICIVPDIKETYYNMKILFELTEINKIPFKFLADFKLILIVNGMQTASSMYPCPYCFVSLRQLHNKDNHDYCENSESVTKKTYGHLKRDHETFISLNKDKKKALEAHSTINAPLFEESDETYVIEKCIVPELHLLQGFVNHLFFKGLVPLLTFEVALLWPKKICAIPKNYQGRVFEGNACRQLLKSADLLDDPAIYKNVGRLCLVPYITAFKSMDKIVTCCFSSDKVGLNLDQKLKEFEKMFEATALSKTLKIHVIMQHLKECLNFLEGDGLGIWSEQAGESVHREFLLYWNRFKMNMISHPTYAIRLRKAVVSFSSSHI